MQPAEAGGGSSKVPPEIPAEPHIPPLTAVVDELGARVGEQRRRQDLSVEGDGRYQKSRQANQTSAGNHRLVPRKQRRVRAAAANAQNNHPQNHKRGKPADLPVKRVGCTPRPLLPQINGILLQRLPLPPWIQWIYLKKIKEKIIEVANSGKEIAVIVQEQIDPDISGVFFTINPTTGEGFVIEYVKGHLENMIKGKSLSHRIMKLEDLLGPIKDVYTQGKQLEEYFNISVDIEFGIKNNTVYTRNRVQQKTA